VTIIIGFSCKKCIVLAADSQTTFLSSLGATRRNNSTKISRIQFENGSVLVAQAGDVTMSTRAMEIMAVLAQGKPINDYRTVADAAQLAIRQLKQELRQQNGDCSMEELREIIEAQDLHFSLMIAHYFQKEKPLIFSVDFRVGIACLQNEDFAAIGSGSAIAGYVLGWFDLPNMDVSQAALTALYVIEEVKKVDPYCGGLTRLAIASPTESAATESKVYPEGKLLRWIPELQRIDTEIKSEISKRMNAAIQEFLTREK
jgi:20S proteasome alpha/beta subunit